MKMCIPSSLIKAPSPLTFGSCSSQHNSSEVQTYNVTEYEWSAWLKNLPCMCKIVYQKTEGIQSSTITNQRHNDKLSRYLDTSDGIRFMLLQKWTQNNGTISLWQVVAKQWSYHEVKTRNMASKITKKTTSNNHTFWEFNRLCSSATEKFCALWAENTSKPD